MIISSLTSSKPVLEDRRSLNLVVFVSDYKKRGAEKLLNNEVWKKTYSNLEIWMKETSDYSLMLVNEYATPSNIIGILAAAELNPVIQSIGVTFVAHGKLSLLCKG